MLDTKQPCRARPGCLACGFPFWSKLTADQQDALCRATRPVQYPKGARVHSPLESCVGILLLRSGQLRAYILSEDGAGHYPLPAFCRGGVYHVRFLRIGLGQL